MDLIKWMAAVLMLAGTASGAAAPKPTIADLVGICGHTVAFKPELYAPVARRVRDYHPIEWDLGKDTSTLPQWPFAKNRVDWSKVYGSWNAQHQDVDVSLMESNLPPKAWKDLPRDAEAYAQGFAREFGSTGRKLVGSIEVGNEPGAYSDEQYHQLLKAMGKGIRAGDPKMLVATCNMTVGKSGSYNKSVDCLAGLEADYDVLTTHIYAQVEPWPTWKRSYPEDPKAAFLPELEKLIAWRDQNVPAKRIWITEFGWDCTTQKNRTTGDFAHWQGNTDLQQAQWLVRAILCFSKYDVDRAYIYFFNDKDEPQLHGSSGITRNFKPKMSYWALAQLQQLMGEYRFSKVTAQEKALVYEFEHGKERIWAVWSPTGSEQAVLISLPLPREAKWSVIPMATEKLADPTAPVKAGTGAFELRAAESVQYVRWEMP
jgi:hypothetical protein